MIPKKEVEKFRFTPEQKAIMKEIRNIQALKQVFANMGAKPGNVQVSALDQKHQQLVEMMPTELNDSEGQ